MPQSYVYGSPYLGAANAAASGMVPIPATQLSHAAAIAAATTQFYEYQVMLILFFKSFNLNICTCSLKPKRGLFLIQFNLYKTF